MEKRSKETEKAFSEDKQDSKEGDNAKMEEPAKPPPENGNNTKPDSQVGKFSPETISEKAKNAFSSFSKGFTEAWDNFKSAFKKT